MQIAQTDAGKQHTQENAPLQWRGGRSWEMAREMARGMESNEGFAIFRKADQAPSPTLSPTLEMRSGSPDQPVHLVPCTWSPLPTAWLTMHVLHHSCVTALHDAGCVREERMVDVILAEESNNIPRWTTSLLRSHLTAKRAGDQTLARLHFRTMVPPVGLEPTLREEPDFESGASTNSATGAHCRARGIKPKEGTGSTAGFGPTFV